MPLFLKATQDKINGYLYMVSNELTQTSIISLSSLSRSPAFILVAVLTLTGAYTIAYIRV